MQSERDVLCELPVACFKSHLPNRKRKQAEGCIAQVWLWRFAGMLFFLCQTHNNNGRLNRTQPVPQKDRKAG